MSVLDGNPGPVGATQVAIETVVLGQNHEVGRHHCHRDSQVEPLEGVDGCCNRKNISDRRDSNKQQFKKKFNFIT